MKTSDLNAVFVLGTIHVDTRYMLWVMDKIDGAGALIEEMELVK